MMDPITKELNRRVQSLSNLSAYTAVKVLILYWEHGNEGFRKEGQSLGTLFSKRFQYNVEEFSIPSEESYLNLHNFVITSLLNVAKVAKESRGLPLLILHYGGHGDQNDDKLKGEEKRSVWAA